MAKSTKKIEYGKDNPEDSDLNRTFTFRQTETEYDGKTKKNEIVKKQVRNRVIDPSIPEGKKGHITYTEWKTVK